MAKCEKHNLVADFPDHRKLKKLNCIKEEKKYWEVTEMTELDEIKHK